MEHEDYPDWRGEDEEYGEHSGDPRTLELSKLGWKCIDLGTHRQRMKKYQTSATSFAKETTHRKNVFLLKSLLRYPGEVER